MLKKRTMALTSIIFILLSLLIIRITYIQLFAGKRLSNAALAQRISNSEVEKPRGDILDRNGISLTHRTKKDSVILKPLFLRGKEDSVKEICGILQMDFVEIEREIEIKREPIIIEANEEIAKKILDIKTEGVSVVHSLKRYDDRTVARHVLGYLNKVDQVGETGIEKAYEDILKYADENSFSVYTDARDNIIQGLGYRVIKGKGAGKTLNVKLTIDYHIQKIVEEVMERNNTTGAVVVEEVSSGDILAMASKPDFCSDDISRYLESKRKELFNRAVASYNIGSIFKIIVAACALETGDYYDRIYQCKGYMDIGDKQFKCSSYEKGGHGLIGFAEAFARSCNTYYFDMGIKLGPERIIDMAEKFGLGKAAGIKDQGIDEAFGTVPSRQIYFSDGDIANISIGQGNVMVTPLQAADIVATVANGGIKNRVNIVDSIVDSDGDIIADKRFKEGERIISRETSRRLKVLMEGVTSYGTGVEAGVEEYGGSGGKTGSAETGQFIDGEKVVHAWFTGYFPKRAPKYSVAVFVDNGKSGSQAAVPLFAEIVKEIVKKGY